MTKPNPTSFPDLLDVLIVGAGPCGLAVAARLREETPSAIFTDDEHQRYHWINKHRGRMALVQAQHRKRPEVKAMKWEGYDARDNRRPSSSSASSAASTTESPPSLASSVSTAPEEGIDDLEKEKGSGLSTLVIDGTGPRWMERWNRAFRMLEIQQLRSPMFFHVDPGDRDGMLAYTQEVGRECDLWEISGCVGKEMSKHRKKKKMMRTKAVNFGEKDIDERDRKDYFSPSTELFHDYCESISRRYGLNDPGLIQQGEVSDVQYDFHEELSPSERIFTVTTADGRQFYARTVVLAVGPGGSKIFPFPLSDEEKQGACHSSEMKSFPSLNVRRKIQQRQETNLVIVGGGLTSAQIADMAVRKGVTRVYLLMRSEYKIKHFDISLPWMGKFKNFEKAAFWSADTDEERLEMIKNARNGGSITPRYTKILRHHVAHKRAYIHTHTTITGRSYNPFTETWSLTTDPPIPDLPPIDYIYFATGMAMDVTQLPLLRRMNQDYPIETIGGLPCVSEDLMWRADVPLFFTGRLAALRLGPGAPNLEGARLGAERVAWGMEEVLGRPDTEESDVRRSKKCFCGLGNRYGELADVDC